MKARLVVNADDLGLSGEVNAGILWCLGHGFISDTSLLIEAPHAEAAVDGLKRLGIYRAGIHINLDAVIGWSPGGHESHPRARLLDMLNKGDLAEACEAGARSQIERFLSTGLCPSHIDTHHHVHGIMPVFHLILDLACEFGIPAVRFSPDGYSLSTRDDIPFDEALYARMHEEIWARRRHACTRYLEGAHKLDEVGPGDTELVVHPSLGGEPWRSAELETLTRRGGRGRLEAIGVRQVSFHDLVREG